MFRSTVLRGLHCKTIPLVRASRGSFRRYASSSNGSSGNGISFGAASLGIATTLGSILFISPYDLRPNFSKGEQLQSAQQVEAESTPEAKAEPAEAEVKAEPEQTSGTEKPQTDSTAQEKDAKDPQNAQLSQEESSNESEEGERATAYNPDTGEINWDCPCLGGMAHGPCGEEFKAAFSCFVYSEAEPKGIDCVEKFQQMQDCFRKHPEHYAEQLKDEEEAIAAQESVEADVTVVDTPDKGQPSQEQPQEQSDEDKSKSSGPSH